jgi:hypothetical protein
LGRLWGCSASGGGHAARRHGRQGSTGGRWNDLHLPTWVSGTGQTDIVRANDPRHPNQQVRGCCESPTGGLERPSNVSSGFETPPFVEVGVAELASREREGVRLVHSTGAERERERESTSEANHRAPPAAVPQGGRVVQSQRQAQPTTARSYAAPTTRAAANPSLSPQAMHAADPPQGVRARPGHDRAAQMRRKRASSGLRVRF